MKDLTYLEKYRQREFERERYGTNGDAKNGVFKVYVHGVGFWVVASNGGGWDHVSVTYSNPKKKACPTWEQMCAIKNMFFEDEEDAIEYHPKKSEYVNVHPYCLHIWRPNNNELEVPPIWMV